jgi:hypothetical protein
MTAFFDYPKAAALRRVVPKNKIYEHANATAALKELFIAQVDQITWQYKLAPETINVSPTSAVPEIQIFSISLRKGDLSLDVLRAIDRAVLFPIIFELTWSGRRKAVAAFKRPSEIDSTKWVVSEYFECEWVEENAPRRPLPVALTLSALYEQLLDALMPLKASADEDIQARVLRFEMIRSKGREVERTKGRLNREKQFNKRIAINAELRAAKKQLAELEQDGLIGSDARRKYPSTERGE